MDLINKLKRMTDLVELQTELQTKLTDMGLKLVISHSDKHQTYKIKMKKFMKLNMIRWQFNRPANMEKIHEIGESLFGKRQPIFFIFQCIYNQEENLFEIIDGMHRYYALKRINDMLEENEQNSWFYNSYLLLEIKYNFSKGEYIDWFETINKCSPVSEIYTNSQDERKEIVEEVVNIYYSKYNSHFTGALKPNIPNTSREKFTDVVLYICDNFHISTENKKCILKILEDINKTISQIVKNNNPKRFNKNITDKSLEKCNLTGLYLFLAKPEKLFILINEYKLSYSF
jgi:hypothetical protein